MQFVRKVVLAMHMLSPLGAVSLWRATDCFGISQRSLVLSVLLDVLTVVSFSTFCLGDHKFLLDFLLQLSSRAEGAIAAHIWLHLECCLCCYCIGVQLDCLGGGYWRCIWIYGYVSRQTSILLGNIRFCYVWTGFLYLLVQQLVNKLKWSFSRKRSQSREGGLRFLFLWSRFMKHVLSASRSIFCEFMKSPAGCLCSSFLLFKCVHFTL